MASSDIEYMLPPPLAGSRASSTAAAGPSARARPPAVPSSSQPVTVFIEIGDSDDDDDIDDNGADTPPRLPAPALPRPTGLTKTVSAPAVFNSATATAAASIGRVQPGSTPRQTCHAQDPADGNESDDLPDLAVAAVVTRRDKGKGRVKDRPLALSDTEPELSSEDEGPAKKKRKSQANGNGKKSGGSGSDTTGLSKAEQKKLEAQRKKETNDREKAEKAVH